MALGLGSATPALADMHATGDTPVTTQDMHATVVTPQDNHMRLSRTRTQEGPSQPLGPSCVDEIRNLHAS